MKNYLFHFWMTYLFTWCCFNTQQHTNNLNTRTQKVKQQIKKEKEKETNNQKTNLLAINKINTRRTSNTMTEDCNATEYRIAGTISQCKTPRPPLILLFLFFRNNAKREIVVVVGLLRYFYRANCCECVNVETISWACASGVNRNADIETSTGARKLNCLATKCVIIYEIWSKS